jgi:hypothetical protein
MGKNTAHVGAGALARPDEGVRAYVARAPGLRRNTFPGNCV